MGLLPTITMEETKTSRARVAFVLLCGLAVCCSVMYITADASESVLAQAEKVSNADIGDGFDHHNPRSIESVDVKKAGLIMTNPPDGRQRLLTFLDKVERQIAKEVAGRKADIAAVRAQMAKNFAYNQAARSKMKKELLAKMAVNAKKAKDDLDRDMRIVQAKFARFAERENKRNRATINRSRKTREIMRKNNAHAAQIKENAKKARKDLEKAMDRFDKKMAHVTEQAKKGRSKLAAQAVAQDKRFRQYANNKIKEIGAQTAAQFRKVRATMARDRAHADMALKHASARMDAALNANKALQDRRFAKTVSDIAAAKKEANDRVKKFRRDFRVSILQLSGVVQNNKLEQAKVNRQVSAELKRMVKIGDARYKEHLKKDKELRSLMARNKAETAAKMQKLSNSVFSQISKIRKQMRRDRAHAERAL